MCACGGHGQKGNKMSAVQLCLLLIDLGLALILQVMGVYFIQSKGKGAKYIAGFNSKSKEEQSAYHLRDICVDFGIRFVLYGVLYTVGGVIDLFFTGWGMTIASVVFMILVFVNVYQSRDSQFDKRYKK
jgi:ABC-type multidrug transport system fused ATPase/permease subunit